MDEAISGVARAPASRSVASARFAQWGNTGQLLHGDTVLSESLIQHEVDAAEETRRVGA
jgi:proline racemase